MGVGVADGVTVSGAVMDAPFRVAVMWAVVAVVTLPPVMVNVAEVAPVAMVTLPGTTAAGLSLLRATVVADEADALNVTVP